LSLGRSGADFPKRRAQWVAGSDEIHDVLDAMTFVARGVPVYDRMLRRVCTRIEDFYSGGITDATACI
jgi:hypothetical protein